MSRDFYFNKWKETLAHLKDLVDTDIQYQIRKTHDQILSKAVHRLSGVLGQYMFLYNEAIECAQQNLQVQKTVYIDNIVKAIVSRIQELKRELEKLESSNFQFIGHGLTEVHRTIYDIEMTAIPVETRRPEHIQVGLEDILVRAKKKKAALENKAYSFKEAEETIISSVDTEKSNKDEHMKNDEIPEEIRKTREYLALILAHEKTRQVTRSIKDTKLKTERWEKELTGCLQPPARYEIRQKSSQLIQKVIRTFFQLKREHIKNCKRDEMLGLRICGTSYIDKQRKVAEEMLRNRPKLHQVYEKEWIAHRKALKEEILKNKKEQLCEDSRDQIRNWFLEWFESIKFFHDIPKDGSVAIFKGLIPDPDEWMEENKALIIQKEASKKKSPQELKFEKIKAKRQAQMEENDEKRKIKADAHLLKKMMKNPTMHPGFHYPHSKRTGYLLEVINQYHKSWDIYDEWATLDVKVKYVHKVDVEDLIMEAKLEVLPQVDEQMWKELKQLKHALREDYARKEEKMPVDVTKPVKIEKKKKHFIATLSDEIAEKIEHLVIYGFIVEYPKTKIEDFIGDANFGGEDLRSQILPAFPFNYEVRAYWWDRCREVCNGFHKILLVGPKHSGKSILVHALASVNDAVLFELDPLKVQGDLISVPYLNLLIRNVVSCAKAVQPSVIHIKHIQKLFYAKTPPEEAAMKLGLIKKFFVEWLMKQICKKDKITVIGTCIDPWLAKSSALLKQFPVVVLLPDNTYSVVMQILKEWVIKHTVIPADFNVSNLAQVLQGYSYGYLKEALDKFLSADRIVNIAAFGLTPMDVYNYILDDETEKKVEYDKYRKWYTEKTIWGKREMQHLKEQREFKAAVEKYATKSKNQAKAAPSSSTASYTVL